MGKQKKKKNELLDLQQKRLAEKKYNWKIEEDIYRRREYCNLCLQQERREIQSEKEEDIYNKEIEAK